MRPQPRTLTLDGEPDVVVRAAMAKDAQGVIDLLETVASEGRLIALEQVDATRRSMARYLRGAAWAARAAHLVGVAGEEVVGQLSAIRDRGIYGHLAEIGMSVGVKWRRRGIATALIEGAVDWARAFDVEKLTLMVFPHNEPAIALYRKMGFVEEGLRRRHAKMSYGYEDLMEMSLFLGDRD
jgi:RimJ/RimL family protein N-acetyltransferase